MKRILSICWIFALLLGSVAVHADEDCDMSLSEARQAYQAGNYQKAKELCKFVVSVCGSSYPGVSNLLNDIEVAMTPKLEVSKSNISVGAAAGSTSIRVTSNREWSLQNTSSSLFSVSRNGNTVTINYTANTGSSQRTDYFTIVTIGGEKSVRINVTQAAAVATLSVSSTSISAGSSGTTEYLTVTSNKAWDIEYPTGTMYTVTRNGNQLTVRINENTSSDSRSDFFNVYTMDGDKKVKITMTQSGRSYSGSTGVSNGSSSSLSVSATELTASASGGTQYITVTCNRAWKIKYPTAAMYSVTRNGNTLTVRINENTSSDSRTDFFKVALEDESKEIKITIRQSGSSSTPYLTVSETELSASASGGTQYITVSSNRAWKIKYPTAAMYSVTRNGNQLTVRINENTSSDSRTDFFKVAFEDESKEIKITIRQSGRTSNVSASIESIWVDHNVYQDGKKGMRIHIKMNLDNLRGKNCRASAYFYDENGTALVDRNDDYCTTDGKVSCGRNFSPSYDSSTFSDFELFMPYSELHLSSYRSLKFSVSLWNRSVSPNQEMTTSGWTYFTYTP